jgi:hypothetical protein
MIWSLLHCMSPLLAHSGHRDRRNECPLLGVKRTSRRIITQSGSRSAATVVIYKALPGCAKVSCSGVERLIQRKAISHDYA